MTAHLLGLARSRLGPPAAVSGRQYSAVRSARLSAACMSWMQAREQSW
eukprot:CAMPEP_0176257274 /NCGR_PEP_ID=MMETSP0121_2-20121125/37967_1 /TAXON_ID=160619 /ORGANISM="Kryptoperidinium foliaceum, Strain CCMP 1326" /LENGTH=47 /DNA_ID= /DNA_START= /DNA_END= /DNA_ORIENTATION=